MRVSFLIPNDEARMIGEFLTRIEALECESKVIPVDTISTAEGKRIAWRNGFNAIRPLMLVRLRYSANEGTP